MKSLKFKLDDRKEFDEVFVKNASVHIERMHKKAFWITIEAKGYPPLIVSTGVTREGIWYFNIEEEGGRCFTINVR